MKIPTDYESQIEDHRTEMHGRLRDAVQRAILAPSGYNTQPWKFRIGNGEIELFADRRRSLAVVDPDDREMLISCGAALYQLVLALHCDGLATLVHLLPKSEEPDLLACIRVAGPHVADGDEKLLNATIPERHTNRFPLQAEAIDDEVQAAMVRDAEEECCWLHLIDEMDAKERIADLVSEGDHIQANDKAFRKELSQWVHANRSHRRDGMPGSAHGASDLASNFGWFMIRTFDWGDGKAAKDRQLAEGSPLLAVLGTAGDTPSDWIMCGKALARVLLRGTAHGVEASFLNQPIEVPDLRQRLTQQLAREGHPQILLRLGHGQKVSATARRPIEEVLMPQP